jgi:hypothetical protein
MLRAARLDAALYREVAQEQSSSSQAILIVALVGLALGAPTVLSTMTIIVSTVASWILLTGIILMIGTRIGGSGPNGHTTFGPLLRSIGFAHTPRVFIVFAGFVGAQLWLVLPIFIWHLAAVTIAVRETFDIQSTGRALSIALLSSFILMILNYLLTGAITRLL